VNAVSGLVARLPVVDEGKVETREASGKVDTAEAGALMQNGDAERFHETEEVEDMVGQSRRGMPGSDHL
jgi:hypothetical protein